MSIVLLAGIRHGLGASRGKADGRQSIFHAELTCLLAHFLGGALKRRGVFGGRFYLLGIGFGHLCLLDQGMRHVFYMVVLLAGGVGNLRHQLLGCFNGAQDRFQALGGFVRESRSTLDAAAG